MKRITIIGGGASGTLVAANLLQLSEGPLEVNIIEKNSAVGRGVAYSTNDDVHLLNVPAGRMGAYPDDVGHFLQWLRSEGHDYGPDDFVPRRLYGEYLRDTLDQVKAGKHVDTRLTIFEDDAEDVLVGDGKAEVLLASGESVYSESVVLAFGNFLPPQPSVKDLGFASHPKYFRSPWQEDVFDSIDASDRVFIIGTGLSMVDVVLKLASRGHEGTISAISTRGLLPAVHKLGFTYPSFSEELEGLTRITDVLKVVRRHIRNAVSSGNDWRAVIDSMRPATQSIWVRLPLSEKRYFMQHLSRYWNVARHRMAPEAAAVLDRLIENGQLSILRGRLVRIETGESFDIAYRCVGLENRATADAIINCIGSEPNFRRLGSPLVDRLFERGYVKSDPLDFGLEALPNGSLVGQNGEASTVLYTLGTALKGTLWESTAIPEIRAQARSLAEVLL